MTAIYQRSRPIHWDEVVGQEHVKDVLRPALERGRIGHAYLFSGPRGVGKTTTARLIAMTVNCRTPGVKPCGSCDACKSVIAGRHPDVLEIDAASNNSVDDVRDLREKVALQPMLGDKKVYILDEAHMMSKSAFNALLKTLEEPPSHAVFVLATTEPERLPPTILSRCQHYRFRRLSAEEIAGKLGRTAAAEGVNASALALNLIARAADGAMRDGESLLERLLAAGEPNLTLEMVEGALGLPPQDRVYALAMALARGDTNRVMQSLTAFYSDGFAPRTITERVKIALRDQLHSQLAQVKELKESFGEAHLLQLIKALDEEDGRFARASDLIALEMAFTKALLAPEASREGGAVSPALESRVSNLETQVRKVLKNVTDEALRASGQRPTSSVPEFDPMARSPRRVPIPPPVQAEEDTPPFETLPVVQPRVAQPSPPEEPKGAVGLNGKGWADVILKADLRFRAILKEAKGSLGADTLVIEYSNPKNKWHADQVAAKLEELAILTRQVIGENIALELVMPDGSKKNSRGVPSPNLTAPQAAARVVPAVLETLQPPMLERNVEAVQENVVPENALPEVENLESEMLLLNPESKIVTQEILPAPQEKTVVVITQESELQPASPAARVASNLAFDALGTNGINGSLFSAAEVVAALEPDALLESTPPIYDDFPEDIPIMSDDVPLEVFDLESGTTSAPLAALEIDFGDLDAITTKSVKTSSLAGHPNYAVVAKLFSHRVREVGKLELKAVSPENDEAVIAAPFIATDDAE